MVCLGGSGGCMQSVGTVIRSVCVCVYTVIRNGIYTPTAKQWSHHRGSDLEANCKHTYTGRHTYGHTHTHTHFLIPLTQANLLQTRAYALTVCWGWTLTSGSLEESGFHLEERLATGVWRPFY